MSDLQVKYLVVTIIAVLIFGLVAMQGSNENAKVMAAAGLQECVVSNNGNLHVVWQKECH